MKLKEYQKFYPSIKFWNFSEIETWVDRFWPKFVEISLQLLPPRIDILVRRFNLEEFVEEFVGLVERKKISASDGLIWNENGFLWIRKLADDYSSKLSNVAWYNNVASNVN